MQRAQAGQRRQLVVDHRVVLHRARAERIELQRLREVELRQAQEMAHHLRFAEFGKARRDPRGKARRRKFRAPRRSLAARGGISTPRRPATITRKSAARLAHRLGVRRGLIASFGDSALRASSARRSPSPHPPAITPPASRRRTRIAAIHLGDRNQESVGEFGIIAAERDAGEHAAFCRARRAAPSVGSRLRRIR